MPVAPVPQPYADGVPGGQADQSLAGWGRPVACDKVMMSRMDRSWRNECPIRCSIAARRSAPSGSSWAARTSALREASGRKRQLKRGIPAI
jgi:hypothetical protein